MEGSVVEEGEEEVVDKESLNNKNDMEKDKWIFEE